MYPAELVYNNINPKGFFSSFKQWTIQPVANGGYYWPGQNIKILIQSIVNGVMDPYRSHLQITVQSNIIDSPVGLLQVDSSAQSFIEQLVISSKNRQIQRIPQYDVLASWLTDIGLSQMYAQGRQTEGLGYNNIQSTNQYTKAGLYGGTPVTTCRLSTGAASLIPSRNSGLVHPTQTSSIFTEISVGPNSGQAQIGYTQSRVTASRLTKGHVNPHNLVWDATTSTQPQSLIDFFSSIDPKDQINSVRQSALNHTGYLMNLRSQYVASMQNSSYPDSATSRPALQVNLKQGLLNTVNSANTQYVEASQLVYSSGQTYEVNVPQIIPTRCNLKGSQRNVTPGNVAVNLMPNQAKFFGYSNLYSPPFCKGTHQPFISPTVSQCQMQNGVILPSRIPIRKRTFKIPLISAILGLLIPQDQFVLLPIKGLNQILIEIVLSKYAMFTSGYLDISEVDSIGSEKQQQRAYSIKRITYNMHTYQFWDPNIDQYLSKALSERILLNVNMWTLGNQYTIAKGQQVTNNWPVACTSQALNEIVVLFIPSDYQQYSFCRKQFRLSNNITKFQLRVNMQYFPPQPIIGNGGNPCLIENMDDNSNFIQQIFWSNNFMFNKVNPFPRINALNFAINQRCYNHTKKGPMYTNNVTQTKTNVWQTQYDNMNFDTSLGLPWIHQNRFVGKAGYTFSFQPYAHSQYFLVGLDCRNIRQFDVILTAGSQKPFNRQQQMFIFTRSSVIVQYSNNGVAVYGR